MSDMFCFQCEQTAGGRGCAGSAGVCGKTGATAVLQDQLTGALIGLARAMGGTGSVTTGPPATGSVETATLLLVEGLVATATNVNFDDQALRGLLDRVRGEKERLVRQCGGCPEARGRNDDYALAELWAGHEDIRSLKSLILLGLRGLAAYTHHALALGRTDGEIEAFFPRALRAIGDTALGQAELLPLVLETGRVNFKALELLDQANTGAYGRPAPIAVPLTVAKGPFIVVSGHDLHDLKLLLEQTEGQGINVYTHGEMLPAHAYPELKKHGQLKGHFGTAWTNQTKEFDGLPAPVLFTTNCLMPPQDSYRDRVFTTALVGYPGLIHIGADKNFSPVLQKARELGGWAADRALAGANGGGAMTTGFGHGAVLAAADQVVAAVKAGAIRHFFLVGGCDGAKPGRNYFTDLVQAAPPDTVILTLACGKYRFNDLDLGQIGGLPRLMDMGQCNDAYSAIKVALALAEAFGCGVNELPLTLILSWYEQKAVCILLTLLYLGVKNIRLGPSLPAFVSPNVLDYLAKNFDLAPISTPEQDLAQALGRC
ncbi:hydroxylamine reductase [Deltaproteobacteria bacterium]|nr:hydroxylamine reductase [Deltaproteobacteria bacterium]